MIEEISHWTRELKKMFAEDEREAGKARLWRPVCEPRWRCCDVRSRSGSPGKRTGTAENSVGDARVPEEMEASGFHSPE